MIYFERAYAIFLEVFLNCWFSVLGFIAGVAGAVVAAVVAFSPIWVTWLLVLWWKKRTKANRTEHEKQVAMLQYRPEEDRWR